MAVARDHWLDMISSEYLDFIAGGGAAVKFAVVADGDEAAATAAALTRMATERGLHPAAVDGAVTKLHMIQDIFFGIARQIDWPATAQRFMERTFARNAYTWPRPGEAVPIDELAEVNDVAPALLRKSVQQWLTRDVMREVAMAQEFRIAMTRLCLDRLAPDDDSAALVPPVLGWLRGELRTVGALKSAQIFTRITRHNARAMLRSLGRWLRMTGQTGLLLLLDIRRLPQVMPAGTPGIRYTPSSLLDAYEVLRQLVDEADHFDAFLLVVLAGPDFINGDPKRSVDAYTALKVRIWDDVKARDRDNPLAPLVRLSTGIAA